MTRLEAGDDVEGTSGLGYEQTLRALLGRPPGCQRPRRR